MATKTDYARKCQQLDVLIDLLERENKRLREMIVRCKDCKHFEYNHVENVNGIPLIVAHEICMRWGDGVKTSENGYCFLAERKEEDAHDRRRSPRNPHL